MANFTKSSIANTQSTTGKITLLVTVLICPAAVFHVLSIAEETCPESGAANTGGEKIIITAIVTTTMKNTLFHLTVIVFLSLQNKGQPNNCPSHHKKSFLFHHQYPVFGSFTVGVSTLHTVVFQLVFALSHSLPYLPPTSALFVMR